MPLPADTALRYGHETPPPPHEFFFFDCYGDPRVLHSFPTRRSSDLGVDPSEPFVETAGAAVPGADVRLAAAEELPFADASFDVVLSQLVVNFMRDATRGVGEMARVARRTVASCVWDYAGEMQMLRAFWDAALELDPDAPDEGKTMRWCTRGEPAERWQAAGL